MQREGTGEEQNWVSSLHLLYYIEHSNYYTTKCIINAMLYFEKLKRDLIITVTSVNKVISINNKLKDE